MANKIKRFFQDLGERIKTSVRFRSESVFIFLALIFIVMLAVLVRSSPIFRSSALIKAFDPWCQFNTAQYLSTHTLYEYFHWYSNQTWYPEGTFRYNLRPGLIFSTVLMYKFLVFLGIPVTLYDVAYSWPAFMGGLTVLIMYFLGKEIMDEKTGLLAAFFLAFSPGHMQRTVLGFFDNETIGVFAVLGTFLFFIKAVKTGKPHNAVISGMFLGYLCLSWGGLTFGLLLLPLTSLILILAGRYSARLLSAYTGTIGTAIVIYTMAPNYDPVRTFINMDQAIAILFMFFMILVHIFYQQKERNPKIYRGIWSIIKWGSIPALIIFAIIFWVAPDILPFGLGARAQSILNPSIREQIHLVASVGEHKPSPWSVLYYNTLVPLILTPVGVYFAIRRNREEDVLMLVFAMTLLYFTGSMIRIVLLLAPAIALIGAYGLSNVLTTFSNVFKKEVTVSRRRRRQIRKTLGVTEGTLVFAMVGFLMFVQINHAVNVSINQMSWTELVSGGAFHDWEETLAYINENLDSSTVVVSWWDYGYWLSMIGNVTTVNDNGTLNQTRIGAVGLALMQTNEIYSAQILRRLHADYVLVYFGHLVSGLGGDEGKWPWMIRICNDNWKYYKEWGWEQPNWASARGLGDAVFLESEYINASSGLYEDKWFESTLVKLMFYNEPTSVSAARTSLDMFYAQEIEGNPSQGKSPRMDDNGNTWKSHIPDNGQYDFKVFVPYFISSNHLVKIYRVDYTALDSSFELRNATLSTNGIAHFKIANTGLKNITINKVMIRNTYYNFTIENGDPVIRPGEIRDVWVNTMQFGQEPWQPYQYYDIKVEASAQALGGKMYNFTNTTEGHTVIEPPNYSVMINRSASVVLAESENAPVDIYVNVTNTGEDLVRIEKFYVNNEELNLSQVINEKNNNYLLEPGETEEYHLMPTIGGVPGFVYTITVVTSENATDTVQLTVNRPDYKLSILPTDRETPSEEYLRPNPDLTRSLVPAGSDTILYPNGTLKLRIKNDGRRVFGIQNIEVNDQKVTFSSPGSLFVLPGDETTVYADIGNVSKIGKYRVTVEAIGEDGKTAASDTCLITPTYTGSEVAILPDYDFTRVYTNESLIMTLKNIGTNVITLNRLDINGTEVSLANAVTTYGNMTINPGELVQFKLNFTDAGIKINGSAVFPDYGDTVDLKVYAGTATDEVTVVSLNTRPYYLLAIIQNSTQETRGIASEGVIQISLLPGGIFNQTLDTVCINGSYVTADKVQFVRGTNPMTPMSYVLIRIDDQYFNPAGIKEGEYYEVTVTVKEGNVVRATVEVTAT